MQGEIEMIATEEATIECADVFEFLEIIVYRGGENIKFNAIGSVSADCMINDEPRRFWFKKG